MRYLRVFVVALLANALVGCVTTPPPIAPDFVGLEAPAPGTARVYVFRPPFTSISRSDSPAVQLDGIDLFALEHGSYMPLQVSPGRHRLSLRPSKNEAALWLADYAFAVESDQTYFMAIWNQTESRSGTELIPVMGRVPFVVPLPQTTIRNKALRIEFVREEDALPMLQLSHHASHLSAPAP